MCRCPPSRSEPGRLRERRAVLRHGLRRRRGGARPIGGADAERGTAGASRPVTHRGAGSNPCRRRGRRGPWRVGPQGGLSAAPAEAVEPPVRAEPHTGCRWFAARPGQRSHQRLLAQRPARSRPPPSCTATIGSTTPCWAPTVRSIAVLDWEICTLGDPLADVGLLLCYWPDPGDVAAMPQVSTVGLPGFPRRADLLDAYARVLPPRPSGIDYYMAFGYWKLGASLPGSTPVTRAARWEKRDEPAPRVSVP